MFRNSQKRTWSKQGWLLLPILIDVKLFIEPINWLVSIYLENWSWIGKRYVKSAKNTVISTNFLVWKFYGNAEFPHSFGWFARNYAKLCLFTKFPHQEIRWKLRYFLQYKGNSMFKISNEITTKLYGLFSVNLQIGILVREIVGISKCRKI